VSDVTYYWLLLLFCDARTQSERGALRARAGVAASRETSRCTATTDGIRETAGRGHRTGPARDGHRRPQGRGGAPVGRGATPPVSRDLEESDRARARRGAELPRSGGGTGQGRRARREPSVLRQDGGTGRRCRRALAIGRRAPASGTH